MGLSERKNKQKIGNDPRNLTWSQDTNRFSFQHLQKFGWDPSKGLGSSHDGNPNHIKVVKKLDAGGIGIARALKEGAEIGGAGEGLDAVLKRLKAAGTGPIVFNDDDEDEKKDSAAGSGKEDSAAVSGEEGLTVVPIVAPEPRRIMAARNKYIKSKRLASQSPAAMAEILGIPISALPSSGASTPVPTLHKAHINTSSALSGEPITADSESSSPTPVDTKCDDGRTEDMLTTAPISVFEYFRRKLAQKKAEREGLPVPEMSYAPEAYNQVAKDFEGKKIKFDMDVDEEESEGAPVNSGIGSTSSTVNPVAQSSTEAASLTKEQRKALQRAAKDAEKAARKAAKAEQKRQAKETAGKKRKRDDDESTTDDAVIEQPKKRKGKERASDDITETMKAKKSTTDKKEKRDKSSKSSAESVQPSTVVTGKAEKTKKDKKTKKDVSRLSQMSESSNG